MCATVGVELLGGLRRLLVWVSGEDFGMPYDAIAYYGLSLIVFLSGLLEAVYSIRVNDFMVYVTYAITGTMAIVLGWLLIRGMEGKEE